jgi:hypothetical protein
MSRWFRFYDSFITDPDVEELSFEDQRHFVYILCMKSMGLLDKDFDGDTEKRDRAIARRLGLQGEAFTFAKQRLLDSHLIDESWQPRSWDRLQFKSDHDAAERQRRSRANKANVTVTTVSRDSHALEQNRTDTESDTEQRVDAASPPPPATEGDEKRHDATSREVSQKVVSLKHDLVIEAFHQVCPDLPRVKSWPARRQQKLRARIAERVREGKPADTVEYWQRLFRKVAGSDFLCGRKTDWRADLEWLLESKHFDKLIEGGYDNGGGDGRR